MLPGGFVNSVVRVGDTVRRRPAPPFVHRVLAHLAEHDWPGAPRFLGIDDQGREILSYVDGHVPWQHPVRTDASLAAVARLVREFHDLTAGTALAGDAEVVCHNDLSPRNCVYRPGAGGLLPVAFIDWDIAAPGARIHDVAHACWQFVGLGPGADPIDAARRVRLVGDAYGLADRTDLVGTILWWQDRCWRGIDAQADAGDAAMARLRAAGAVRSVRAAHDWTAAHRQALERFGG